jgi:hypothetical protein
MIVNEYLCYFLSFIGLIQIVSVTKIFFNFVYYKFKKMDPPLSLEEINIQMLKKENSQLIHKIERLEKENSDITNLILQRMSNANLRS